MQIKTERKKSAKRVSSSSPRSGSVFGETSKGTGGMRVRRRGSMKSGRRIRAACLAAAATGAPHSGDEILGGGALLAGIPRRVRLSSRHHTVHAGRAPRVFFARHRLVRARHWELSDNVMPIIVIAADRISHVFSSARWRQNYRTKCPRAGSFFSPPRKTPWRSFQRSIGLDRFKTFFGRFQLVAII